LTLTLRRCPISAKQRIPRCNPLEDYMASANFSLGRHMSPDEVAKLNVSKFNLRITVEFGDGFVLGNEVTSASLIDLIDAEVARHPLLSTSALLQEIAELLRDNIKRGTDAGASVSRTVVSTFYACGDCTFGGGRGLPYYMDQSQLCKAC